MYLLLEHGIILLLQRSYAAVHEVDVGDETRVIAAAGIKARAALHNSSSSNSRGVHEAASCSR